MAQGNKPGMFHTVAAGELRAERDVLLGMPTDPTTNKQTFHRVPVRSAHTESPSGDRRTRVQYVDGSKHMVQSVQGLPRLLVRFPPSFVPGIKVFEASGENDRTNLSMGFALYDYRVGPTPEEQRVLDNIDALAAFLRDTLVRCPCEKLRRMLKLDVGNMSPQVAADMMDLHVARPAADNQRSTAFTTRGVNNANSIPPRYCYVKLVAPDPAVNEVYHTYFWTVDGKRIPFDTVRSYRNFHVQPFVEIEDIFVSKAMRSLQMKLRECLVVPPAERMQHRPSVCFPERACVPEAEETDLYGTLAAPEATTVAETKPVIAIATANEEAEGKPASATVNGEEERSPKRRRANEDTASEEDVADQPEDA
jgi:hypothetical protein